MSYCVWKTLRLVVSKNLLSPVILVKRRPFCNFVLSGTSCHALARYKSNVWPSFGCFPATRQKCDKVDEHSGKERWWTELEREREDDVVKGRKSNKLSGSVTLYDFKESVLAGGPLGWATAQWEEFETIVLAERQMLARIWEAVCMNLLLHKGFLDDGIALINYIRHKGRSPNLATLTAFIALCGEHGNKSLQHLVFESYDELQKVSQLLDSQSCKHVITGLCGTDRWKEAIPLLEMAGLSQQPNTAYYSPIAQAAFTNGHIDKALEILDEIGDKSFVPQPRALVAFIEACASDKNSLAFPTLFEYFRKYSWFPTYDVLKILIRACRSSAVGENWLFTWTKMDNRGVCKACGHRAGEVELSEEEFRHLQKDFLEKAVIGKDVFLKTSPHEMQAFLDFVKNTAPYDVVLDSLNIAFRKTARMSTKNKLEMVHRVVDYFWRRDKTVMLLGRQHMLGWSSRELRAIHKKAHCFFAENISQDDPFLLYAALSSGRHAVFVSNDEMRDHKYLLGPKAGSVFKQWQRSRQIYFLGSDDRTQRLYFQMPEAYDTLAQKDESGWHIPYENQLERVSFQHPNAWLCIRQKH